MSFQFTENTVANRALPCERVSCKTIIQPGESRLAAEDVTGHVKFVCAPCRAYYDQKAAKAKVGKIDHTVISSSRKVAEVPLLDFQTMRQNVNESQRQGGHAPGGRVTALPVVAKVSQLRYRSETPIAGYSANHSQHALQQSIWSQRAYKGFNAHQVGMLTINLLVYAPTFTKGQPNIVDGIKEGVRISSDITARALSKLIRQTLLLPLVEFCGPILFDIDEMVIRNTSNGGWTKVDESSDEPYFGKEFLKPHPRKKDGGLIFSIPANMKPPVFGLVFSTAVWKQIEAIQEEQVYGHRSCSPGIGPRVDLPLKRKASVKKQKRPARKVHCSMTIDRASSHHSNENESEEEAMSKDAQQYAFDDDGADEGFGPAEEDKDEGQEYERPQWGEEDDDGDKNNTIEIDFGSVKRQFIQAVATAQSTKPRATNPFVPLDTDTIRQGFLEGGINSKTRNPNSSPFVFEQINFIELPEPTFSELISNPTMLRELMLGPDADIYDAYLRYDPTPAAHLGVGSFKTTSKARLTFNGLVLPSTGLGKLVKDTPSEKRPSLSIALKRPYRTKCGGGMARMALAEEESAVFEECKLLIWANSLLKAAYDYMSDFMAKKPNPPPFSILNFRFVTAGMAIALKPLDNAGPTPTTSRAAYILEEMLPGNQTDFVKYLHNASAISDLTADDPDYQLAEFLMFIQHVQFKITDGVAYVSDFQGVGTCLTDPQILTTPYDFFYTWVKQLHTDILDRLLGNNLFGDGNLGEAFDQFPTEHQCNKYCKWFELKSPSETLKKREKSKTAKRKTSKSSKVKKLAPAAVDNFIE